MEDENRKLIKLMEKNHLQGLIKFPSGDIMMLSKSDGERLEILESAKTELLYNDRVREERVDKMLTFEQNVIRKLNKFNEEVNYVG